ncbi:MAG: DUF3880 domain-containing protein [Desulfonatronovibrio sp.]
MHERPAAVKIKSELGLPGSVSAAPGSYIVLKKGTLPVFLGLGPEPALLEKMHPGYENFLYIECPELERQLGPSWKQKIPANFTKISPDQLVPENMEQMSFILYTPGLKNFPEFWTDVLARIRLTPEALRSSPDKPASVFIFGNEHSLLVPEIYWEIEQLGLTPILINPACGPDKLCEILRRGKPELVISVNLQGMDQLGEHFAIFNRLNIPVALWMVDNPFHLLTSLKSRYWTRAVIFVTDNWFIKPLKAFGASAVHHLPLAAAPAFFRSTGRIKPELQDKTVFVGRSSFPGNRSFFGACPSHPRLESEALKLLSLGQRPDFAWWSQKLNLPLWPGNRVREMGLGAERTGLVWKKICLKRLADKYPLVVYGDKNWKNILPQQIDIQPEIDYYGPLASIYSSSGCILNLTNMHLPHGLTQRHFDVWAAHGFLITDKTRGLEVFPQELAREISFCAPREMLDLIDRLNRDSSLKNQIQAEFYKLIKTRHTYRQRLENIFNLLNIKG